MSSQIGLIAGNRKLPLIFCKSYRESHPGNRIIACAVRGDTSRKIEELADRVFWVGPSDLDKIPDFFTSESVKEALMLGQITPLRLFRDRKKFSPFLKKLLHNLEDLRPDTIFTGLASILEEEGIKLLDSRSFLQDIVAQEGQMSIRSLNEQEKEDVDFAKSIVLTLTKLDIGQTLVVKNKTVLSVEAFEGTDSAILRTRRFTRFLKGGVVVKIAGPTQDVRFDIPTVGPKTLDVIKKSGLSCLALEAGKTFILDKEKFFELADKYSIAVLGIKV